MQIKELNQNEFETFINKSILGNHCQTLSYAKVMEKNGYNSLFLGLINQYNQVIGATLLLIKKLNLFFNYAYAPKGFVLDYSNKEILKEFTIQIKKFFRRKNILFIKINPEIAIAEINLKTYEKKYNWNIEIKNYLIDLGYIKLKDNLYFESKIPKYNGLIHLKNFSLDNINKNTRNKIKRSITKGLKMEIATDNGLNILYEFIKRKKDKKFIHYLTYKNAFKKENIDVFLVSIDTNEYLSSAKLLYDTELKNNGTIATDLMKEKSEKKLNIKMESDRKLLNYKNNLLEAQNKSKKSPKIYIAGALTIKYKNRVNIIISGYDQKYKKFNPNYFLHYKLIEYYKNNYDFLDINGLTGDFTKDNPYYGLNEFKLGFKPKVYEFIGEYDLPLYSHIYKLLSKNGILAKKLNRKIKK